MSEWKTIDSAPLDGTLILLWSEYHGTRLGSWRPNRDMSYPFVWASTSGDTLVRPWKRDPDFTHWHPVPAYVPGPEFHKEAVSLDEDAADQTYCDAYHTRVERTQCQPKA